MNLGNTLLKVRETAKLSQVRLAELLKTKNILVKPYTISKWENGISRPTIEAFLAICEICRVRDIQRTFSDPKRVLRLYDLPVSAGRGNYLDGGGYEMIEADPSTPDSADYAIRVSGDSMAPRFADRQIIFIHEQPALDEGEIGVFCLNNDAYLKQLGKDRLLSLNPAYAPIPVGEYDDLKVFGKVVG